MESIANVSAPRSVGETSAGSQAPTRSDFLKLLIAQLSHQDPLAPQDDTAFVSQLAQFAELEQSQNQTDLLKEMQAFLRAQNSGSAIGLIGREVTARMSSVAVTENGPAPVQFVLDSQASQVRIVLRDSQGNIVRTITSGPHKAGVEEVTWDGRGSGGQRLAPGSYRVEVTASDESGRPVGVRSEIKGAVTGVSLEGDGPVLMIGRARVSMGDISLISK